MIRIQHKTVNVYITSKGVNVDHNNSTANIISDLQSLPSAIELFGDGFILNDGNFHKSINVNIPNLFELGESNIIETSDVGKTQNEAMSNATINIIYNNNLLNLQLENWMIV